MPFLKLLLLLLATWNHNSISAQIYPPPNSLEMFHQSLSQNFPPICSLLEVDGCLLFRWRLEVWTENFCKHGKCQYSEGQALIYYLGIPSYIAQSISEVHMQPNCNLNKKYYFNSAKYARYTILYIIIMVNINIEVYIGCLTNIHSFYKKLSLYWHR